uniref:Putative VQ domain-containing protein n=1 Tax=Oryza minuta TaxID=63629 RepID=G9C302_ORYMI|nr:putative VQ domain-containing protein [Oryza minuta]
MKHHAMKSQSRASSSAMAGATHKFSHAIAKAPPRKIKIVHVLAPEVIKTDARHFRELVQRLTGKPATDASAAVSSQPDPCDTAGDEGGFVADGAGAAVATIKAEIKVEEAEASGGFLHALGEEDRNDMFLQWLESGSCIDMDAVSF